MIPRKNLGISERFQDFREDFGISQRFHEGFGISKLRVGFQDFFRDFKISSEISAKPYEISASGGPLGLTGTLKVSLNQQVQSTKGVTTFRFSVIRRSTSKTLSSSRRGGTAADSVAAWSSLYRSAVLRACRAA